MLSLFASPLTELKKNEEAFIWFEKRELDFKKLKEILASKLVLKLPYFEKTFEVKVDACGQVIGGIPSWLFRLLQMCSCFL